MKQIKFIEKLIEEEKIKLNKPSDDISNSYKLKSKNSLKAAKLLDSQQLYEESISMSYYSMFHILQSLLFKVGIKCENHGASIILLKELFDLDNSKISYAKEERIDKQYYIDFELTQNDSKDLIEIAEEFNSTIYEFINNLNNEDINGYYDKFKDAYFK